MGMSLSTFYYKPKNYDVRKEDSAIVKEIIKIIENLPDSGYRPVTAILNEDGLHINHKKTLRIMRENGLLCRKNKRFNPGTTDSRHKHLKYPNIIQKFIPTDINQAIVGDVTAFNIKGKDHYLAHLMDLYNREIIGVAVSDKNNTELVIKTFLNALKNRGKNLQGAIHHTDADVRYCSSEYISLLEKSNMKISMCVGNAYENAHSESWNKTVKRQEINVSDYESKEESALSIFSFVKKYNIYRPHSALGNKTPVQFLQKNKKF